MLEQKFAIYYRAASLSSQASSVCSIGWGIIDQALFKYRVNNGWKDSPCLHGRQPYF